MQNNLNWRAFLGHEFPLVEAVASEKWSIFSEYTTKNLDEKMG
jgi:hypothetical protein